MNEFVWLCYYWEGDDLIRGIQSHIMLLELQDSMSHTHIAYSCGVYPTT